jgi:uncharacterized protein (TIGR00730 family)
MATARVRLVYGGGSIGLMGVIADTVLAAGGKVTGIIPDFLMDDEVGHHHLTEQIITGSMHDRKRRMFELADGFVVMPGGLGTLDETFEIVTWKLLRLHDLPIIFLDTGGYWTPLRHLVDGIVEAGFAPVDAASLFQVVSSPEEVFATLEQAPEPRREAPSRQL